MINFKKIKPKMYTSSSGKEIEIQTLSTPYLENIIKKLDRDVAEKDLPSFYKDLQQELTIRKLRRTDPDIWITANKDVLLIKDLTTDHLKSIVNMFDNHHGDLGKPQGTEASIRLELAKREYIEELKNG
ncbi:hypothetical protein H8D85_02465 [bacterium]|nr:hypothetical protein [bacterium]